MISEHRGQRASNFGKSWEWGFFVSLHSCTMCIMTIIVCTVLTIFDTSSTSSLSFQDSPIYQEWCGIIEDAMVRSSSSTTWKPTVSLKHSAKRLANWRSLNNWKRKATTIGYVASDVGHHEPLTIKYDTVKTNGHGGLNLWMELWLEHWIEQ